MGIIVPVFIDLPDNARVLPSISMARFFHQAGMWFNKNTTVPQPPFQGGHESGALLDHVRRHRLQRSKPLFASCLRSLYDAPILWGAHVAQRRTLECNIRISRER